MARLVKEHLSDEYEIVFIFANTTREHPDTYRFLRAVDEHFGLDLVKIEAVVHEGRKSCTHRVVSWDELHTEGEVFEQVVAKYGLPNQTFKLCTRELKLRPMESYFRELGWKESGYTSAIGIRTDELRRVSATADAQNIMYPLVDLWPTDKLGVLDFFSDFDWDLAIREEDGNCRECHKKSRRKLQSIWQRTPEVFEFPLKMERLYSETGPNNVPGPRKQYRGRVSASELIEEFRAAGTIPLSIIEDGGCSESCEVYDTEVAA